VNEKSYAFVAKLFPPTNKSKVITMYL